LLPDQQGAIGLGPGIYLDKEGLRYPLPEPDPAYPKVILAFAIGLVAAWLFARWARARQMRTGAIIPVWWPSLGFIVGLPLAAWLLSGAPSAFDMPHMEQFGFEGGASMSPEFLALLFGLVTYTATFIAEIVRAGILAVSWGQTEAASALGLRRGLVLRLVLLPQALRVIVPPLTSQYLNIVKNSSLAVAIGYPDLAEEKAILGLGLDFDSLKSLTPCMNPEDIRHYIAAASRVHVASPVDDYILAIVRATRSADSIATPAEREFLQGGRRVELNAFTSPQFIEWIERKLTKHLPKRLIPATAALTLPSASRIRASAGWGDRPSACACRRAASAPARSPLSRRISPSA